MVSEKIETKDNLCNASLLSIVMNMANNVAIHIATNIVENVWGMKILKEQTISDKT